MENKLLSANEDVYRLLEEQKFDAFYKLVERDHQVLNLRDEYNRTLFLRACHLNDSCTADFLLTTFCEHLNLLEVDPDGFNAFHLVSIRGNVDLMRHLLMVNNSGLNVVDNEKRRTPLHWAAYHNRKDMVGLLLSEGADLLEEDSDGFNAFHLVSMRGNVDLMRHLLIVNNSGLNVADNGNSRRTPLHWAAYHSREDMVGLLLSEGADLLEVDYDGFNAFHLVSKGGNFDLMRHLLMVNNSGLNVADNGNSRRTPLHWAAYHDRVYMAEFLLSEGADVNITDNEEKTPDRLTTSPLIRSKIASRRMRNFFGFT